MKSTEPTGLPNFNKTRVRATMAAISQSQGRSMGGRPPYGYRLVDAGPHPNPSKAADGKRLHVYAIDIYAAAVVERIFTEYVERRGLFAIAEGLTADGILCPSAYDRKRNRHRSGLAWSKGAVRTILMNPKYTGRQVWNKQRKREVLYLREDALLPHLDKWVGRYFAAHRRADTVAAIVAAQHKPREDGHSIMARQTIDECDRKLARYRAALEALDDGADPSLIAGWISEAQKRRTAAEARLRQAPKQADMSQDQITGLIDQLSEHAKRSPPRTRNAKPISTRRWACA